MFQFSFLLVWLATANAHLAAFHKGMYCLNGPKRGTINYNSNDIVKPLYELPFKDWWFHHVDGCDEDPPAPGDFIDLPAGKSFTVEIASNQGKTSLSFDGKYTSEWPDGNHYPEDYNIPTCIISPNMHAQNHSMAAGTAFAISYQSDIKKVTPENLVVFSVAYHTPWKRETTYQVPADMPPCPPEKCICAWGWVPNGCGQPNMYHQAFSCDVSGSTSTIPLAKPKPPTWCEGDPSSCTKGAKQMIYWNQQSGNNIEVDGFDLSGGHKSPGYNAKCGFSDGAQNDIFATDTSQSSNQSPSSNQSSSSNPKPSSSSNPKPSSSSSTKPSSNPKPNSIPSTSPNPSPSPSTSTGSGSSTGTDSSPSSNSSPSPNASQRPSSGKCKSRINSSSATKISSAKRRLVSNEDLDGVENHAVPQTIRAGATLISGISSHMRLLGHVGRGRH